MAATAEPTTKNSACADCATALSDCAKALDDQVSLNAAQRELIRQLKAAEFAKDEKITSLQRADDHWYKQPFFTIPVAFLLGALVTSYEFRK